MTQCVINSVRFATFVGGVSKGARAFAAVHRRRNCMRGKIRTVVRWAKIHWRAASWHRADDQRAPVARHENAPAASRYSGRNGLNPVTLFLCRFMAKLCEDFIRQKVHIVINLPKKASAFGGTKHAVLFLVILEDVTVDPLPMSNVEQLADEMMCPVVAGKDAICREEMGMLY